MSAWREVTLEDVLTLQRGFDITKKLQRPGSVPVISSSGIGSYHDEARAHGPGVVIGRKGSLGTVFFVDRPYWPHDTTLWVKDFRGNDPYFCYLLLKALPLAELDAGSSNPTLNRNHAHMLPVRVPQVGLQRRISAVVAAFDELIEINERQIELLEDLARSLYRQWFVRLRLGDNAVEWDDRSLFAAAEVGFGFSFKSAGFRHAGPHPVVRIRDVPQGTTATFTDQSAPDRYSVRDGDVLIGMDGDFHINRWSGGDAYLNQRVARLRPKLGLSGLQLMLSLEQPIRRLNQSIVGTTVAHLGKRHLEDIKMRVPRGGMLTQLTSTFEPIGNMIIASRKRVRALARTRDLLLRRLITGRIDISDIDLGALLPDENAL